MLLLRVLVRGHAGKGTKLVDKAVAEHVENEVEMLSVLLDPEQRRFDAPLRKLLHHLTTAKL